nr:DPP IV N-terminal domain-containing protein [Hyphomonas sp. Mor2]
MMRSLFLPAAALIASACATPLAQTQAVETNIMVDQKPLTIERLFASPSLSGPTPTGVKYSPDGTRVTFLKASEEDGARFDLWQFDVATGAQSLLVDSKLLEPEEVELSEEEKALRERKRIAGRKGIVSYDWGTADTLLVPLGGDLHLITLAESGPQTRQLTNTDAFEYDAKISPSGTYASFIRDGAVYAIDLDSGEESRLTPAAEPDKAIAYGVAEFVAQEEMSRYTGYWWSPDDRYLAYTKVDESTVDIIPRFDIAAEDVTVIEQRYPRAGRPNAIVDLFVRDMETGEVTQLFSAGPDSYLARVNWSNGDRLWFQSVERDQKAIKYHVTHLPDDAPRLAFAENQQRWVNLNDDFLPLDETRILITQELNQAPHDTYVEGDNGQPVRVFNEPDPYRHIQLMLDDKGALKPITSGTWPVDQIVGRAGDTVFFTGHKDTPLERHLYSVQIRENGPMTAPVRLTEPGKSWSISMAPDGQSFVGTSSSPTRPPQTGLYRADGSLIAWIEENKLDDSHAYAPYLENHTVPEYGTLTAEDGQTLYYSIQLPPDFDASKTYPALVEIYGGPHVQTVNRNWERLSDQFYSRQGYVVFRIDNRGMANRGKAFEDVIYRQMGIPEVRDVLVGVDWLKSQPFVDGERVGIQGWSYGGYMTLMTILQAPEGTFAAAVAGAPVTDWALYDTFYTERYMDTPQDNAEGYETSSVFHHLDRLETDLPELMLIHGMADDNVTFDNTTRLMAELQQRGIVFELMTYPGQRHGIRGQALGTHLMRTRMSFLDRHLK